MSQSDQAGDANRAGRFAMTTRGNQTSRDREYLEALARYFDASVGDTIDKLQNFSKFVPQPALNRFLCRHALFQLALNVHGSILECGVHLGGGLMTWAQLSALYEPLNHIRKIVGFDTFEGFAEVSDKDRPAGGAGEQAGKGHYAAPALEDLQEAARIYDMGRQIGHIPKVQLVPGDAARTIPQFVADNPHLVVSLLYLDFDVFEPTKVALEHLLPRMPKGAILAFDELAVAEWPGETLAVVESVGLGRLRLQRFQHHPQISYAVLD